MHVSSKKALHAIYAFVNFADVYIYRTLLLWNLTKMLMNLDYGQCRTSIKQHGFIGINLFAFWIVPLTNTTEDAIASQRAMDFMIGW
jgi:hypothetical protein